MKTETELNNLKLNKSLFIHHYYGKIQKRYKIGDLIGGGGFAYVRQAKLRSSGAIRAIKTIRKTRLYEANVNLFYNEIELLKSIDHPHVLKVYEAIEDDKNYHIVTELLKG